MANLLIGESSEELLQFIDVNMDLFSIVGALEKVVNGLFVSLFNVELDEVGLDKCDDIPKRDSLDLAICFDIATERTKLGIKETDRPRWIILQSGCELLVFVFKNLANNFLRVANDCFRGNTSLPSDEFTFFKL